MVPRTSFVVNAVDTPNHGNRLPEAESWFQYENCICSTYNAMKQNAIVLVLSVLFSRDASARQHPKFNQHNVSEEAYQQACDCECVDE